jgi:hypothetical protein
MDLDDLDNLDPDEVDYLTCKYCGEVSDYNRPDVDDDCAYAPIVGQLDLLTGDVVE